MPLFKLDTAAQLRELLGYDPATGVFRWRVSRTNRRAVGDVAGCLNTATGYVYIGIGRRLYRAHRLAWLYVHGAWPEGVLDHVDGNPSNNAIENLRDGSQSANMLNLQRAHRDSSSGFLGVQRSGKRWSALLMVRGKRRYLGAFDTPEAAHAAYIAAKSAVLSLQKEPSCSL